MQFAAITGWGEGRRFRSAGLARRVARRGDGSEQAVHELPLRSLCGHGHDSDGTCVTGDDIDLVIPHQANLRIIESVAKHAGVPLEHGIVTVQKYGNMSAATAPGLAAPVFAETRVASV